jgi:hypothetical protein
MSTTSAKVGADGGHDALPRSADSETLPSPAATEPGASQPAAAADVLPYESVEDDRYPIRINQSVDGTLTVVIPARTSDRVGGLVPYAFVLGVVVVVVWFALTGREPPALLARGAILSTAVTAAAAFVALIVRHCRHWAEPVVLAVDATHVSLHRPTDVRARRRWERARVTDVREGSAGRGGLTKLVALVVDGRTTVTVTEGRGHWNRRHIIQAVRAALGMPPAE